MQSPGISLGPEASTSFSKDFEAEYLNSSLTSPNVQNLPDINFSLSELNNGLNRNNFLPVNLAGNSAKLNVVKSELMGDYLAWPVPPSRKGKRETERFPFAITAKRFQEMHIRKREMQKEEEIKKLLRKRRREEAKQIKETAKIKKAALNKQTCKVCNFMLKTSYKLQCDECQGLFHKKCIPRLHKDNIPDENDGDKFFCHMCYKVDSNSCSSSNTQEEEEDVSYEYDTKRNEENIEGDAEKVQRSEASNKENDENYIDEDTDILFEMYEQERKSRMH